MAGVRFAAVWERVTPRYLPDEFLYTQLARSLSHGHGVEVLGEPSPFPALLEPIVTALFWAPGDAELAYRLTQLLHAVLMALAALPVFLLARRLGLRDRAALAAAAVTIIAPGLLYVGYATADALAYLLTLVAVYVCVGVLARPTLRGEAIALSAMGLASFARIQYAVLLPAMALAALVVQRGRPLAAARRYPLLTVALLLSLAVAAAASGRVLGRYESVTAFGVSHATGTWLASMSFLVALSAGVAMVPGAVAWLGARLVHPAHEARGAFAALATPLLVGLIGVSTLMAVETGSDRFHERYLIVVTPLLALAFLCWVDERYPWRRPAVVLALLLVVAIARVPLSGYSMGQGSADSPTLLATRALGDLIGVANTSLAVALVATVAALVAALSAAVRRPQAGVILAMTLLLLAASSVGAHVTDARASRGYYGKTFSGRPDWVDATGARDVLLVQTAFSARFNAMTLGFWNPSITGATSVGSNIDYLDGIRRTLGVDPDGTLRRGTALVRRSLAVANAGTTTAFAPPAVVRRGRLFDLVDPRGPARLSVLAEGVRPTGWLAPTGRLIAFPAPHARCSTLTLSIVVPARFPRMSLTLDERGKPLRRVQLRPGEHLTLRLVSGRARPSILVFRSDREMVDLASASAEVIGKARLVTGIAECGLRQ
jgi:Dolichyl-phosphate-mannose-protein mannosyltransferase